MKTCTAQGWDWLSHVGFWRGGTYYLGSVVGHCCIGTTLSTWTYWELELLDLGARVGGFVERGWVELEVGGGISYITIVSIV